MTEPIKRRPRWLRFSLRTLLVVMTVLCVWLGWKVNAARRQKEAVDAILKAGGTAIYDFQEVVPKSRPTDIAFDPNAVPWEPHWLDTLIGRDFIHNVTIVDLYDRTIPSADFARLHNLKSIKALNLGQTQIKDQNTSPARPIRDDDLELLRYFPGLLTLTVDHSEITDEALTEIGQLKNLRFLWLSNTQIGDEGVRRLQNLHNLLHLNLDGTRLTDAGLEYLAGLTGLNDRLGLCNTAITDNGLHYLTGLTKLKQLHMVGSGVTVNGARQLHKSLPKTSINPGNF